MKIFCQQFNISWVLGKFGDKFGNWREQLQEGEEDVSEVGVRYIQREDESRGASLELRGRMTGSLGLWDVTEL